MITFDDFKKVDIRVGNITKAERIPKSSKLLRLEVDFGEELGTRQVVAGIGKTYDPDALIGQSAPFVVNLEPVKMMGVESAAMILAAGTTDGGVEIVSLRNANNVTPGTAVG